MESESERLARDCGEAIFFPSHGLLRLVRPHGNTVGGRQTFHRVAALVHDLGRQFAVLGRGVDEQVLAGEFHRPRRERAARLTGVEGCESVAAEDHEPGAAAAVSLVSLPGTASAAAVVEVELVADDEAAAAGRLHVSPAPVAGRLGDTIERPAVRAVPVEAVAAEPD